MDKALKTLFLAAMLLFSAGSLAQSPIFIDVRSTEEFQEGHVAGAELIPHEEIAAGIARLQPALDTPLYLYCRSGRRAGLAAEVLRELGYSRVINLETLENAQNMQEQMLLCAKSSDAPGCSRQETPAETAPAAFPPREG
ncbi:rhodanese-like domain-containing protein [Pseudohalioglobus sediminis]|uniref:Rhodanese-like domain-containing protein n=2 Tax=Pseudohalioglobus sediminis TaxID=2606449 RepID=A0A5B0WQL2_9GAMM|nr:rhodanese-like domain-containing protein [Pseudohalioglobus sediminis]